MARVCRAVILADDSASWKIAGLSQLERLALALDELAVARAERLAIYVSWSPEIPQSQRFLPRHPRLARVEFATAPFDSADLLLSTRILLHRNSIALRLDFEPKKHGQLTQNFAQLSSEVRSAWSGSGIPEGRDYLEDRSQIAPCEKRLLRGSGKSQDGLVSRFLNRPISRAISRVLLKTSITPSAWTLAIVILPLIGAGFLARGDYLSVLCGLAVFQVYSILDGCDGEIARAKYLDSSRGRALDGWCDIFGNLLLALSLGYGLSVQSSSLFSSVEGIIVAGLIAANELLLLFSAPSAGKARSALYPRHQQMVESSGLLIFGERFAGWLMQVTKRDVALLFFVLLALLGRPAWILHLLGATTLVTLALATKAKLLPSR
jgi:CDP-L-myo-inositol myo-inositolphosphotransferase